MYMYRHYIHTMGIHIYCDEETNNYLRILKERNTNISNLFKEFLIKELDLNNENIIDKLQKELDDTNIAYKQYERKIKELEQKLKQEQEKLSIKEKDMELKKTKDKEQFDERVKYQIKNIKEFYDIPQETKVLELANEFVSNYFEELNIFDFMKLKGYTEKVETNNYSNKLLVDLQKNLPNGEEEVKK